jgi:putative hydroxymethylpyrimidine transport system substrate-binding protein
VKQTPPYTRLGAAIILTLSLMAGSLAGGCGESQMPSIGADPVDSTVAVSPELPEVDLIMDWVPWVLDIPIDVAQAKGFYDQQGIRVHQTIPADTTDVVKLVSTGRSQFGLYYSPDMLMALNEGAPLLSLGSLMSHAPVGVALKPGFIADSPAALEGKIVSVPLIPSTRASFTSMLRAAGVDPDSVEVVDPGFELVGPLLTGTVDAAAFTEFAELVQATAQGQDLTYLDFRDWGTPDYAFLDLITTQEFAESNPNTTRAFVRATFQGLEYAAAHPEEAVALYVKTHPELDPALLLAQWTAAIPFLARSADGRLTGWQDLDAWEGLNVWMDSVGLISGPFDLGAAITNDYLGIAE